MKVSPLAGKAADQTTLVNVPRLITAYYAEAPDSSVPAQRVAFGTSGHRGSSLKRTFNEDHILAITQAICLYRKEQGIGGPLFLGLDTHALSVPALTSALEVLAANGVEVMLAEGDEYTPTPAISHESRFQRSDGHGGGLTQGGATLALGWYERRPRRLVTGYFGDERGSGVDNDRRMVLG